MLPKQVVVFVFIVFISSVGVSTAAISGGSGNLEGINKSKGFRFQIDGRTAPSNSIQRKKQRQRQGRPLAEDQVRLTGKAFTK